MHIEDELNISKADIEDLQEILNLQYLAYQSEAALFGSRDIPPLKQTLDEVIEEYHKGIILKLVVGGYRQSNYRFYPRMGDERNYLYRETDDSSQL